MAWSFGLPACAVARFRPQDREAQAADVEALPGLRSQDLRRRAISIRWTGELHPAPPSTINRGEYSAITCGAAPS